jgi:hypothetical protein
MMGHIGAMDTYVPIGDFFAMVQAQPGRPAQYKAVVRSIDITGDAGVAVLAETDYSGCDFVDFFRWRASTGVGSSPTRRTRHRWFAAVALIERVARSIARPSSNRANRSRFVNCRYRRRVRRPCSARNAPNICGSELHIWRGDGRAQIATPQAVLGHEAPVWCTRWVRV